MASRTGLSVLILLALASSLVLAGEPSNVPGPNYKMEDEPSGEKYDFEKTGKPERPWEYPYHRMCVTKLNTSGLNVAQLLGIIRMFDNVTLGIKKVIYMSGMGFRYPSWETLDDHFKSPQDKTSLEAVRWLMKEAREKHNTLLSVHINMLDAMYQDTELYRTYLKYDIIHKQKDGTPSQGQRWGGRVNHPISYYQEWKLGFAQKRIDGLLKKFPDILNHTKSVHIDAFQCWEQKNPQPSPYLGHSQAKECETMRKIFRYFKDKGVDVTAESPRRKRNETFVGLQPWCWIPYQKYIDWHINDTYPPHIYGAPYIYIGGTFSGRNATKNHKELIERHFIPGLTTLVIGYKRGVDLEAGKTLTYPIPNRPRYFKRKPPKCIPIPKSLCLPIGWREDDAVLLVTEDQHEKDRTEWTMPESWKDVTKADILEVTAEGLKKFADTRVRKLKMTVPLKMEKKRPYVAVPKK